MKKSNVVLGLAAALLMASCGGEGKKPSESVITEKDVKSAVESLGDFQRGRYTVPVMVGYYELSDANARYKLRQLASNGVISYNAEQINEYTSDNQFVAGHVFVSVSVTDEGKKYIIEQSRIDSLNADVDMLNRFADETYPMDSVSQKEVIPVRNPLYVAKDDSEEIIDDSSQDLSDFAQPAKTLYQAAKAKENAEDVSFLAMTKTIYKIENIVCDKLMQEQGTAQADVIVENTEVTPFGRIVGNFVKGEKERVHLTFKYFVERGWDVENSAPVVDDTYFLID